MDESDWGKLDTIVGKAIKALALSGASDSEIGAFAFKHRVEIAQILGLTPSPPPTPTNEELIVSLTSALRDSLNQAGGLADKKKPLNVVLNGKRTSITLSASLIERLRDATGSDKGVKQEVERVAKAMPQDTDNRSAWLTVELEKELLFKKHMITGGNTTAH